MAEPQANTPTESGRTRGDTTAGSIAESRSFEETQKRLKAEATPGAAAQIAGAVPIADQSRLANRQLTEAWRQAVDPLLAMQYDITRWFDDVWRQTFGFRQSQATQQFRPMGALSPAGFFGLPPADLRETPTAHLLTIELPGLTLGDIDVSLDGESLVVCGHKAEENTDATAAYRMSERRYGRFERLFPLPNDVDRGKIGAQFRDGVLKITLPKDPGAAASRSKIEIKI